MTRYVTNGMARKWNAAYDAAHDEYLLKHRTTPLAELHTLKRGLAHTLTLQSTKDNHEHEGHVTGALVAIGETIARRMRHVPPAQEA